NGKKVLHVDTASNYGGIWRSYLLSEFIQGSNCSIGNASEFSLSSISNDPREKCNLELFPKFLYARGPLADFLGESRVGRHLEFKSIQQTQVVLNQKYQRVPMSKEDVFSMDLDLVSRRKLMKLFKQVLNSEETKAIECSDKTIGEYLSEFNLPSDLNTLLLHGVIMSSAEVPAQLGLQKLRTSLQSQGRFGNTWMLLLIYPGGSELIQTFCRVCAVYGGVYRLSVTCEDVAYTNFKWNVTLSQTLYTCSTLVVGPDHVQYLPTNFSSPILTSTSMTMAWVITSYLCDAMWVSQPKFQTSWLFFGQTHWTTTKYLIHGRGPSIEALKCGLDDLVQHQGEGKMEILQTIYYYPSLISSTSKCSSLMVTPSPTLDPDFDADFTLFKSSYTLFTGEPFVFEPLPDPEHE
ncbi:hypothetical protein HMI54_007083, partial [Coelomomyces lativittatus]